MTTLSPPTPEATVSPTLTYDSDVPPDARVLALGTQVQRYILGKCLGAGGMGVVYEALDPQLDRKVALKLLTVARKANSVELKERMLREAHALAQLSHPNVVPVFDCGAADDDVYITMELVD